MRIAFVVAVFPPEPEPASVMAGELVNEWARAGHDVNVICPLPNRPGGEVYPEYRGFRKRPRTVFTENGARVARVWSWFIGRKRRHINRMLENLSFGVTSSLALLGMRRPDLILMETWPIMGQLLVASAGFLRRVPVINYIQDVYPEAASAAGVFDKGTVSERMLRRLDRLVCRAAARNIVIAEGMRDLMVERRKIREERFVVIPNWLDLEKIKPFEGENTWRCDVGIPEGEFVCMFAGTMGLASNVDILIDVADRLRGLEGIRIVCVGEGLLKSGMEREIERRNLTNISLLPFQPRERVAEVHSSADVLLVTSSPRMGFSSLPSKLIAYLAVGKPVICAVSERSDLAKLVEHSGIGMVAEPGSADAIAAAVIALKSAGKIRLDEMGQRARAVALERYSLRMALERFDRLFRDLGLAKGV